MTTQISLMNIDPEKLSDYYLLLQSKALLYSNAVDPADDKTSRLNELRQELFNRFTDEELRQRWDNLGGE